MSTLRQAAPFPSLAALRQSHALLLEQRRSHNDAPEFLQQVVIFIERASATGVFLDNSDDRWSCQSLLDYWANVLDRVAYPAPDPTLAEFDPALAPILEDHLCPYVGLDAFQENSHRLFFGRQRIIGELAQHLQTHNILIVLGPSGSGKSSLVMGGLLPELKAGVLAGSEQWHYYPVIVPGTNPLLRLAQLTAAKSDLSSSAIQEQASAFVANHQHLRALLDQNGVPALIVIDQFEEIFTLVGDEKVRLAFVNNLLNIVQTPDTHHRLIITMRSDFEERITLVPQLEPFFEYAQFRITPLNASELREVIEQPALQIGLKFEEGVVDRLVQDALGEPAALPLLQFTLLKLWEGRDHNRVTLDLYRRLGGGRLALARAADALYEGLIPEDQRAFQRILLRLARPSEGLEVTSNRVRRQTLYYASEAPYRIDSVLDKLMKARLIRITPGENYNDDRIEVAHEALIRNWPRLVEWLDEARVTMRRRLRLTADAERWSGRGQSEDTLLRGELLAEALRYDDLNELELAYVQASEAAARAEREQQMQQELEVVRAEERAEAARNRVREQDRSNRQLRIALVAFIFASVFMLIVTGFAIIARYEAGEAQKRTQAALADAKKNQQLAEQALQQAEEKERISTSLQLAASAQAASIVAPDLTLLLGVEALKAADTAEARNLLQNALTQTFRPLAYLRGHPHGIEDIAFSPNNELLVSASADGLGLVWDVKTRRIIGTPLIDTNNAIYSVAFSPDGTWIATGTSNGDVLLWSTSQHTLLQRFNLFPGGFTQSIAFRPDNSAIAASGCTKQDAEGSCIEYAVSLLTLKTGAQQRLPIILGDTIRTLDFSDDGRNLAVGSDGGDLILVDMASNQPQVLQEKAEPIWTIAFSPNSKFLATGGGEGNIQLWDVTQAISGGILEEPDVVNTIRRLQWTNDSKTIIAVDLDGRLTIWDTERKQLRSISTVHGAEVDGLALSPDGRIIATAARNGQLILWDASKLGELSAQTSAFSSDPRSGMLEYLATSANPPYQQLAGHPINAQSVVYSHNGRIIATAGYDRSIVLHDAITRQQIGKELRGHSDWIYQVAFSPDDRILVSSSADRSVVLWDMATYEELRELEGHLGPVYTIAFSPDGKTLASAGCHQQDSNNVCQQGEIRFWDIATGKQIGEPILAHTNLIWSIAFNKDGTLASGGWDHLIIRWDIQKRQMIGKPLAAHTDHIYSITFSPDGTLLASAGRDRKAIVWDARTGIKRYELSDFTNSLSSVAFSPDNAQIVTGGWDSQIRRWEASTGKSLAAPLTAPTKVSSLAFSPDGTTLASANGDGSLAFWHIATGEMIGTPIISHFAAIRAAVLSPDEKLLATAAEDYKIIVWDTTTHAAIHTLQGHTNYVLTLAFSHDGSKLISGSGDRTVRFWDMATGEQTAMLTFDHPVTSVALNPTDTILGTGSCQKVDTNRQCSAGEIRLWTMESQAAIGQPIVKHTTYVRSLAFSPDGRLLTSAGDQHIYLWNAADGTEIGALDKHTSSVVSLAFNPDGSLLVSAGRDGKVILWETATRSQLGEPLAEHSDAMNSVAFTADGKLIAGGSDDNSIIIWNVDSGKQLGKLLSPHIGGISSITIANEFIVSSGYDGKILVWGNQISLPELACDVARRNLTLQEWNAYFPGKPYHLTCPELDTNRYAVQQVIDESINLMRAGDQAAATTLINDTTAWVRTTKNANIANTMCWFGSLAGFAETMRETCEYAVQMEPDNASIRDSRGLMYALAGDTERAIEDFQYYIDKSTAQLKQDEQADITRFQIAERRLWIDQLKAGQNPFDAPTIRHLQENE